MPTVSKKTVKPAGGGDYTSLVAWEAGEQRDLTTLDEIAEAECYSGGDLLNLVVNSWTTTATNYIYVYPAAGERHQGVWDTTYAYAEGGGRNITLWDNYVYVEGLQYKNTNTLASQRVVVFPGGEDADTTRQVRDCLLLGTATPNASNIGVYFTGSGCIINCIVEGFGIGCLHEALTAGDNCGCYNSIIRGSSYGWRVATATGTKNCKNCYCYSEGANDDFSLPVGSANTATVATADASSPTVALRNIALDTSTFTDPTAAIYSRDYSLPDGSPLIDVGTDVSADNGGHTTDILQVARDSSWDVGPHEWVSAAPPAPPPDEVSLHFPGPGSLRMPSMNPVVGGTPAPRWWEPPLKRTDQPGIGFRHIQR